MLTLGSLIFTIKLGNHQKTMENSTLNPQPLTVGKYLSIISFVDAIVNSILLCSYLPSFRNETITDHPTQ